jgi:hypothetical protein
MSIFWITGFVILWAVVLFLGFSLLGTLRSLGLLNWRLEQLEGTTLRRLGRDGLKPGKKAPDFTLPYDCLVCRPVDGSCRFRGYLVHSKGSCTNTYRQ